MFSSIGSVIIIIMYSIINVAIFVEIEAIPSVITNSNKD